MKFSISKAVPVLVIICVLVAGYFLWVFLQDKGPGEGFISGNGRIEATEIDIAAKLPGRIERILVNEGDFVKAGQLLAVMQSDNLEAQRNEAIAQHQQAITAEVSAKAQVNLRESEKEAAIAIMEQRASDLDAGERRLTRTTVLTKKGALDLQSFDDDQAKVNTAKAAVAEAKAKVAVAAAAIETAKSEVLGAQATIKAAEATIARIETDIADCKLTAPRDGRIQYRIAQPGEVLPAGGKVLNLVDLTDVYLTFFLPEMAAGKVEMGSDVRIIVDAAPDYVIPSKVTFVASTAQFTPKMVETQSERQKLMFRVKAQIDPALLTKYITYVKTGLPGVAWVKLDPQAEWPEFLAVKVGQ